MIITHNIPWDKCLSKQLFPAIEKGWTDTDKPIHFFWGLAGQNRKEIRKCMESGEEWWYVDVGYLTQQITRYPEPKIHDYDKTYFRICKGKEELCKGCKANYRLVKARDVHKSLDLRNPKNLSDSDQAQILAIKDSTLQEKNKCVPVTKG